MHEFLAFILKYGVRLTNLGFYGAKADPRISRDRSRGEKAWQDTPDIMALQDMTTKAQLAHCSSSSLQTSSQTRY